MSAEYGDPAIEWNEANAANDDGQAAIDAEREAERLHLEQMATVIRQWLQALGDARLAVVRAQTLQPQLADLDYDFSESSLNNAARLNLNDAWRSLDGVTTIANGLLKPIVDAEKDAEIERLRAELTALKQQRAPGIVAVEFTTDSRRSPAPCSRPAWHGFCGPNAPPVLCDITEHHTPATDPEKAADGADPQRNPVVAVKDRDRYHGFVSALDGSLRFCASAPGHKFGCRDSDGHVIITAIESVDGADPIDGQGSDLD